MNGNKISSKYTTFLKKKFLIIIYIIVTIAVIVSLLHKDSAFNTIEITYLLFGIIFTGLLSLSIQKNIFDNIADEVYDCGDYLRIIYNKRDGNLYLKNIINVNFGNHEGGANTNITLQFSEPFLSGMKENKISFILEHSLTPYGDNNAPERRKYIETLIQRIDEARRNDS